MAIAVDVQPSTAHEENQSIRKAGAFTLIRRRSQAALRGRNSLSQKSQDSMQAGLQVQTLPSVQSNGKSQCSGCETTTTFGQSIVPGTAVTTDDAVTMHFLPLRARVLEEADSPREAKYASNLMAIRRSRSMHLDRPRPKRPSWFQRSKTSQASDVPPLAHLPSVSEEVSLSPSMPLPPSVPSSPSTQSQYSLPLSATTRSLPSLSPATTRSITPPELDQSNSAELAAHDQWRWTQYSVDDLSEAFSLMPDPSQEAAKQLQLPPLLDHGRTTSTAAVLPPPLGPLTLQKIPEPSHSRSVTVTAVRSPSPRGTLEALVLPSGSIGNGWNGWNRGTTRLSKTSSDEDDAEISLSEDQQRDYNRLTWIMEMLDQNQTNDAMGTPKEFEVSADGYRPAWIEQRQYSNEQALAAFEFDPISEGTAVECSLNHGMSLIYSDINRRNDSFDRG
ncbi:hypothetical protein LTR37_015555 [Vermiconidia calcicola]|uniref:Uncharacterized protein n=1 Tax=Vermiconidia calcicola TaxID=1690605 RepID=A0ACC3MQD7_9PEZI|nr:hypothetical protein LTR37_015555 [Vermiconidia calcicola]